MTDAAGWLPKVLAADFRTLKVWSVAAQFEPDWQWPADLIKPVGRVLKKRSEAARTTLSPDSEVALLTIRFDGSIEERERVRIADVKGTLYRVEPGDVVFSKIDVRNGAIGLAPADFGIMCVSSEFPVYRVDEAEALPRYIELLFRTRAFRAVLNSMISGASGRKRIQPSQLESVRVPIPPLPLQERIVGRWEEAERARHDAERDLGLLVKELDYRLKDATKDFHSVTSSRVFVADYSYIGQWDLKAGRASAFIASNPDFVRFGDHIEECTETVRPWDAPDHEWPIYGVSNSDGVFLSARQKGRAFNAPYKRIEAGWFFHNPTRANVGSLAMVGPVPGDAITSPEYQVWRLTGRFVPGFVALLLRTDYFLALVDFNRVGGVKQRMYYANLAEIKLPLFPETLQAEYQMRLGAILEGIALSRQRLEKRRGEVEDMILGRAPGLQH
ncbi:hypothetical protein [Sphingopyxis fribergensis]